MKHAIHHELQAQQSQAEDISMQRVTIELLHEQALKLLQQLEKLNVLRMVGIEKPAIKGHKKWAGTISKKTALKMLNSIEQGREEWKRDG